MAAMLITGRDRVSLKNEGKATLSLSELTDLVEEVGFDRFDKAGGFEERAYWPGDAAAQYREQGSMQGLINVWEFWRKQHEAGWLESQLKSSSMDLETREIIRQKVTLDATGWEKHMAELRDQAKAVTEPDLWQSVRYTNPLQPVVGISLYEALAYCHWLRQLTGQRYTLPNELQWGAAARGLGNEPRRYAWEGGFRRDYANCRDEDKQILVGAPTPVGLYEQGKTTDHGLYDMTGSIWEWTSSLWRAAPPYDTQVLEHMDDGTSPRVVLGGSWDSFPRRARSACRSRDLPGDCLNELGCRVCVLPR